MFAFIFAFLFSVGVAYFATQNTSRLTLHLATYVWSGIPIYILVLGSLLAGFLFACIFQILNSISSSAKIKNREHALKEEKKANLELIKHVHQLELENTKLAAKEGDKDVLDSNSL